MKKEDIDKMLNSIDVPVIENVKHQQELKIPLLSFKRSSRAGLWLLVIPVVVAVTFLFKYEFGVSSPLIDGIRKFFDVIDNNPVFTYLIPLIFVGLPLTSMIINLLAFCHFNIIKENKELVITVKYRLFNLAIFLFSFAVLVFFLLPDKLSF